MSLATAPDTVVPEIGLWSVPPLPDVPEALHWAPVVLVAGVYIGPVDEAGPVLAPLRHLGTPLADMTGAATYVAGPERTWMGCSPTVSATTGSRTSSTRSPTSFIDTIDRAGLGTGQARSR